jgi:U4/U6.U5 tri-snRNP-associated protein 2
MYDLLANVTIDSTVASTTTNDGGKKKDPSDEAQTAWKIFLRCGRGGGDDEKWFEMQDLLVQEVRQEMVFLGETVIQVWERHDLSTPTAKPEAPTA